jgi:hypothetical protein
MKEPEGSWREALLAVPDGSDLMKTKAELQAQLTAV